MGTADLSLRQVGESYKDYAARMAGTARAAEVDRDAELRRLRAARSVLREREAELLELKGPCRTDGCPLHYAHRGPCDLDGGAS